MITQETIQNLATRYQVPEFPNIVSGDKHLLSIRIYKGIKIISAREFLEFVQKEKI